MIDPWYESVSWHEPITQGDIIRNCPLVGWRSDTQKPSDADLKESSDAYEADVVIMSQACDLEQGKIRNVVVCPHVDIEEYRTTWEKAHGTPPNTKQWRSECGKLERGHMWNLAMLNQGNLEGIKMGIRIVYFDDIHMIPRSFLECVVLPRDKTPRLRLRAPYREHLSQSFARYFMRVGLPVSVARVWEAKT